MGGWIDILPPQVRGMLEGRLNLQKILVNTGWLLFDRIFRMGVGLFVGVWVARYLGPEQFGLLNYAMSFTAVVGSFAALGLESIVVREIVQNELRKNELLGTALGLRVLGNFVVIALNVLFITTSMHEPSNVQFLVIIIAIGFFFQSFDTFDYWFQAKVQSNYSVVAKNIAFLLVSLLKVVAILLHAPLIYFALLATVEVFFGAVGLVLAYRVHGNLLRGLSYSWTIARKYLRDGWPIMFSSVAIVIYMKIDQVMIGRMINTEAVGVYAAAVKIVEIWYFIPSAITISVFPTILEAKKTDAVLYEKRMQQLYDVMAMLSVGLAVIVTIFATPIMSLLYGKEYLSGIPVLTIYIWSGVGTFLGVASSQFLIAENLTRISLYRTMLGMISNVVLNLVLIPKYGIIGSAVATLISYLIATFSLVLFSSTRAQASMLLRSLLTLGLWNVRRKVSGV